MMFVILSVFLLLNLSVAVIVIVVLLSLSKTAVIVPLYFPVPLPCSSFSSVKVTFVLPLSAVTVFTPETKSVAFTSMSNVSLAYTIYVI